MDLPRHGEGETPCSHAYSLLCLLSDSDGETESVFLYDLTSELDTAREIFRIVSENAVSPFHVKEVLEDLL